ncbi:MAG: biotin transporter BioY [Clostridiales bacterium]|nr:biotin transporter BioY [Clostridiales bacterium]
MKKTAIKNLILCALFSALICIGAFIKIPFILVPITLQTHFVLLCGLILGAKLGFISVAVYVLLGLVGLPVFTQGGGIGYVLQPTFGYILGFGLAALISGYAIERFKKKTYWSYFLSALLGYAAIYIIGLPYFYVVFTIHLGKEITIIKLLLTCFIVFIPSEMLSIAIASYLAKRLKPFVNKV